MFNLHVYVEFYLMSKRNSFVLINNFKNKNLVSYFVCFFGLFYLFFIVLVCFIIMVFKRLMNFLRVGKCFTHKNI